nr:probable proteasome inhibitor [Tanacetum cinerariifolium]
MASEQSVLAIIRASRPKFKTPADKITYAIHSIFLATGFNLNATGPPAFTDDAFTAPFSDEAAIDGWNEVEDNYAFVYSSPDDSSKKVLVKCLVMNDKLFIDALAAGSSDPIHLEINIDDFVRESDDTKYSSQFKDLGKLVETVNKNIVTKLNGKSTASTSNTAASAKQRVEDDNARDQPRGGGPYGLEDPYGPYNVPPVYPVGGGDLFPQPGAGMYPQRGGFGDDGMLVGPNNPMFVGRRPTGFPGGQPNPRTPPGGTHPDLEHFGNDSDFI